MVTPSSAYVHWPTGIFPNPFHFSSPLIQQGQLPTTGSEFCPLITLPPSLELIIIDLYPTLLINALSEQFPRSAHTHTLSINRAVVQQHVSSALLHFWIYTEAVFLDYTPR